MKEGACLAVFVVLTSVCVVSGLEKKIIPYETHPMLYFSPEDISELRSKASGTHEKISADLREAGKALLSRPDFHLPPADHATFAARWNEVYGNNLNGFAMYCFLYPQDDKAMALVMKYMDTMASYPDWYVAESKGKDQVPVGHSLTGFATAYDILYDRFDTSRRTKYFATIKLHSEHLYGCLSSGRFGWTKQYTHNHAASNIVALLLGALVVSVKEPKAAAPWIIEASDHLDTAMKILKHVTDGSLDEGVAYGSYTSRGFTQYVHLAKRHLDTDHTENPWLKAHFNFYYKTILPGFQRTVGIGDANHNWFFGPISQLLLLDSHVMRNGHGNWLASKIRRAKPKNKPLASSNANCWSMLHTEYIFYNASLKLQKPPECPETKLHIYSDWGVVTYGGGQDMKRGNTFLSFKSAVPNGEAAEYMIYNKVYPSKIDGWQNFNPGHEHPDQNSFVFAPNGRYFITEALYGPKLTYLDNVYSFAPSETSECNEPWEGQLGECSKWLRYKNFEKGMRGEILTATTSGNMAFIAGEAAGVYRESLGLSSVFRGVLLLHPGVLVVFDSIKLHPESPTKKASATFHNMLHKFKQYSSLGHEGAQVYYPEGPYRMFSMKVGGSTDINVTLHEDVRPQYLREGATNFINVTYSLERDVTSVIHVFSGPKNVVKSASAQYKTTASGISLRLVINGIMYEVDVSTMTKSRSRKTGAVEDRIAFTGFAGYARVKIGPKEHHFGFNDLPTAGIKTKELESFISDVESGSVPQFSKTTLTSSARCSRGTTGVKFESAAAGKNWILLHTPLLTMLLTFISIAFVILIVTAIPSMKTKIFRRTRSLGRRSTMAVTLLFIIVCVNFYCLDSAGSNSCIIRKVARSSRSDPEASQAKSPFPSSPFIFISALPASGARLLESLFQNQDDFLFLSTSNKDLTLPTGGLNSKHTNLCLWKDQNNKFSLLASGWLGSLRSRQSTHFNQLEDSYYIKKIKRQIREHRNAVVALSDCTGFWVTKIPWMRSIIGKEDFISVLIVRDPRSWIHAITTDKDRVRRRKTLSSLVSAFDHVKSICSGDGIELPAYYQHFKRLQGQRNGELHVSEKLAAVWTITIANALTNEGVDEGQRPTHIVRFEDLITDAGGTSADLFGKLGFPLGLKHMNKLTRLVRSEYFRLPFDGVITPKTLTSWKEELPRSEFEMISEICCPVMKILNYDCSFSAV